MPDLCLNLLNFSPRFGGSVSLDEQLDAAALASVRWVGLDAGSVRADLATGRGAGELSRALSDRGLRCFELLFLGCEPDRVAATLERADRLAEWCGELQPEFVLVTSTAPLGESLVDLFRRCAARFTACGVRVAFECFPWGPMRLAEVATLLRRAAVPGAGAVVDAWHFLHGAGGYSDLADLADPELAYVQLADSVRVAPENALERAQDSRRYPGDGVLDLTGFVAACDARGYRGVVSVEVLSPETRADGVVRFASRCVDGARSVWPALGDGAAGGSAREA